MDELDRLKRRTRRLEAHVFGAEAEDHVDPLTHRVTLLERDVYGRENLSRLAERIESLEVRCDELERRLVDKP
ncbi:hypothetical protein [Halegenticoccus soli]|uniref:hypothetical protein n=1 Tax=Halegenticoccus soli TaxID=1985678 RepID=UPI000C6E89AE|nr:hypothetical protein [Halegenticoccus soli]